MNTKLVSFVLTILLSDFVNSATFENVTVLLTTQLGKLFLYGKPPIAAIFIPSSETLTDYINHQPLEVVTIRNQKIPKLVENSLSNLSNIVHLSIISSGVTELEPGTFKNVPKLDGLNLEGNLIKEIKNGVFTGLQVKFIYLNNNKISIIENNAFNNMTLTLISLNNNRISAWNTNWFLGSPVGSIYIAKNRLEEVPPHAFDFGLKFKRLNVPLTVWNVVLAQNRIKKVHKDAFKHVNGFGYLSLADNNLEELPREVFHSVKNINTLDLTNNNLYHVNGVFDDININQLILLNNSLSCFPMEVFDISTISYVFVDGNPFTCVCVERWKNFQIQNNVWVVYNMKNLENNCNEKFLV